MRCRMRPWPLVVVALLAGCPARQGLDVGAAVDALLQAQEARDWAAVLAAHAPDDRPLVVGRLFVRAHQAGHGPEAEARLAALGPVLARHGLGEVRRLEPDALRALAEDDAALRAIVGAAQDLAAAFADLSEHVSDRRADFPTTERRIGDPVVVGDRATARVLVKDPKCGHEYSLPLVRVDDRWYVTVRRRQG
ncbi:MAG: hypothetical protein M9894_10805 [Planctomycetes bacterium]|nr:hypothetical protein [Planctomycetota bacterium]